MTNTKETTHSPLPWRKNCSVWDFPIVSSENEIIARLQFEKQRDKTIEEIESITEANAAYIVRCVNAFPALVEALKNLVDNNTSFQSACIADDNIGADIYDRKLREAFNNAKNLIKKMEKIK